MASKERVDRTPEQRERAIVLLVAAVQFVNILDFVMVMPMGPDFAAALGIPASKLGLIGGSYTAAAAFSALLGLVAGTAMGSLATGMNSLLAARIVAGLFGGPATSLSFSIIADVVPAQRRGTAMGIVMGAFSIASVLGVPAGLEAARHFGWRAPFIGVASLGLCIAVCAVFFLPPLRGHLLLRKDNVSLTHLFRQRNVLLS